MKHSDEIKNELATISELLTNTPKVQPYTVPSAYWLQLTNAILLAVNKQPNYAVPDGYFANLAANIIHKAKAAENDEIDELSPLLQQLRHTNPYTVPSGYFEQLNSNVVPQTAKLITMQPKRKANWWKYVAAACVLAIVSLTAINLLTTTTKAEDKVIAGTNLTYKQIQQINVDAALDTISTSTANQYLCDNGLVACNNLQDDEDLQKQLDNLSVTDEELETILGDIKQ